MESVLVQRKKIVREVLNLVSSWMTGEEGVRIQPVFDDENGHYLVTSVGWTAQHKRELNTFIYIDVREDGKVWIHHDGTDLVLADWFIERGIPSTEIVLGFQSPRRRKFISDFAVE